MATRFDDSSRVGLMLVDLQNDFLHPHGAYGPAGGTAPSIAALPARTAPPAHSQRNWRVWIGVTQFTLVPGPNGELFTQPSGAA